MVDFKNDVELKVCICLTAETKAYFNRDITEDIAHSLADDITSYLNDSWGLSMADFFLLLKYNAEDIA